MVEPSTLPVSVVADIGAKLARTASREYRKEILVNAPSGKLVPLRGNDVPTPIIPVVFVQTQVSVAMGEEGTRGWIVVEVEKNGESWRARRDRYDQEKSRNPAEFEIADQVPELVDLFRIPLSIDISDSEIDGFNLRTANNFPVLGEGEHGDQYEMEEGSVTAWIEAPMPAELPHPPGGWRSKEIYPLEGEMTFNLTLYTSEGQGQEEVEIDIISMLDDIVEEQKYKNTPPEIEPLSETALETVHDNL